MGSSTGDNVDRVHAGSICSGHGVIDWGAVGCAKNDGVDAVLGVLAEADRWGARWSQRTGGDAIVVSINVEMDVTWILSGQGHSGIFIGVGSNLESLGCRVVAVDSEGSEGVEVAGEVHVGNGVSLSVDMEPGQSVGATFDVDVDNCASFTSDWGVSDDVVAAANINVNSAGATSGYWASSKSVRLTIVDESHLGAVLGDYGTSEVGGHNVCDCWVAGSCLEHSCGKEWVIDGVCFGDGN